MQIVSKYIEHDGTGLDRVCVTNKNLRFKWSKGKKFWDRFNEKWIPSKKSQTSEAKLKNGWTLKAINWNTGYGFHINHYDNIVLLSDTDAFPDRLSCQIASEKALLDFLRKSLKLNFKK